ncbi:sensor histidine kinase [Streptomyces smaragdinus]|uniref:sensor histidine kinase n=1 Tax=Streptomyces smaragdinus TaxID=2585196 RepID=UPI002B2201B1|nr:histidine kinase [Streptomyces smaragdinus]
MNTLPAVRRRLRAHPYALDTLIAALTLGTIILAAVHPSRSPSSPPPADLGPLEVLVAVAASAALIWRRRAPRTVLALSGSLTIGHVIMMAGDPRSPIAVSVAVALYTVASRTDRHTTWRIALITTGVLTGALMFFGDRPWYADENLGVFAWTGMAAGIGDAVRSRRAFVEAIQERAERAEATREQEARRRVTEERMRIARELHDVVAHHIALVNVQAGVASHVMDARPDQAKEALAHVREASRSALDELRTTVGLLRQSDDPAAPKEPAPGLGVLDQLVDGFVRAGVPVAVEVAVDGALPTAVDLTAYRVLQEALTNVHKHAGPDARVEARVLQRDGALEVSVRDDGRGPGDGDADGDGGHGLIGMRERTSALGGSCRAGARTDGTAGYEVLVRLPLQTGSGAGSGRAER